MPRARDATQRNRPTLDALQIALERQLATKSYKRQYNFFLSAFYRTSRGPRSAKLFLQPASAAANKRPNAMQSRM